MSYRRSLLGLLGGAVLLPFPPARAPGPAERHRSPCRRSPSRRGALPSVALEGFCADFASKIEATWPNIDASTAAALAPVVSQWADKAEMAEVKADVTTIATWITTMATARERLDAAARRDDGLR